MLLFEKNREIKWKDFASRYIFFFYLSYKFMAIIIMYNKSFGRLSSDTTQAQVIFSFQFNEEKKSHLVLMLLNFSLFLFLSHFACSRFFVFYFGVNTHTNHLTNGKWTWNDGPYDKYPFENWHKMCISKQKQFTNDKIAF